MRTLVVYDSVFGNTRQIARAIATCLDAGGTVQLIAAADCSPLDLEGVDLLVVGGPTHRHGISPAVRTFLDGLPRGALQGISAAAFDTRYAMPRWLTGSAAVRIARALKRQGARLVEAPESFLIERDVPPQGEKRRHELERLKPGEEERADRWARRLSEAAALIA